MLSRFKRKFIYILAAIFSVALLCATAFAFAPKTTTYAAEGTADYLNGYYYMRVTWNTDQDVRDTANVSNTKSSYLSFSSAGSYIMQTGWDKYVASENDVKLYFTDGLAKNKNRQASVVFLSNEPSSISVYLHFGVTSGSLGGHLKIEVGPDRNTSTTIYTGNNNELYKNGSGDTAPKIFGVAHKANNSTDTKYLKAAATCTAGNVYYVSCSDCQAVISQTNTFESGAALGHDYENGSYISSETQHWKKCSRCDAENTENKTEHSGGTATCTQKAACVLCGKNYGQLATHNYVNGVCQGCNDRATFEVTVNGFTSGYNTIEAAWEAATSAGTAAVKMNADATVSSNLHITYTQNITLDLNGYMLALANGATDSLVVSYGTFILNDSYDGGDRKHTVNGKEIVGGVITGGKGYPANTPSGVLLYGGGIYSNGAFTMNGGTITGNTAELGGGVYLGDASTMNGGKICDNFATKLGGGAYIDSMMTMKNNAEISGNSVGETGNGGGVYVDYWAPAALNVSDAVKITGNKKGDADNNVCLYEGSYGDKQINVGGALTEGAKICVYKDSEHQITSNTYTQSDDPSNYFVSDNASLDCIYAQYNRVYFETHSVGGDGVCVNCGTAYAAQVTVDENDTYYETFAKAWNYAKTADAASVKLFADANIDQQLAIYNGKSVIFDLNGHTLSGTAMLSTTVFQINVGGALTLKDESDSGTGKISSGKANSVRVDGVFVMDGGQLCDGTSNAVWLPYDTTGSFTMNGGKICGNNDVYGAGVNVGNGTFIMNDGEISGNTATEGGGVEVERGAFEMRGGIITNNTATDGGGVYVCPSGTLKVSGSAQIYGNKKTDNSANNVYYFTGAAMTVSGKLTEGAKIGVYKKTAGSVATGYSQNEQPSKFFVSDIEKFNCIYKNSGAVNIAAHSYDKLDISTRSSVVHYAYGEFHKSFYDVYPHCSQCNNKIDKIDSSKITVTYINGNCLHKNDTYVTLSATVDGQTLTGKYQNLYIINNRVDVIWEYTTSETAESAWVWNTITDTSSFIYDGNSKNYRVRARFTGVPGDPNKDTYYFRATDSKLLVDGSSDKSLTDARSYSLSLDSTAIEGYDLKNNSVNFTIKPYEIELSDAAEYRWTLGADKNSLLRNAYIEKTADNVYLYYDPVTGAADGRTYVTRSVVRYRGDSTDLNIVLNGGEIADLFAGTGKRTNITYSGTTAVGALGKYTAIATLTLNDTNNYKYAGEITVADSHGMTIVITENGAKAVITKEWYVATINNGLIFFDGGEYSVSGWTFGEDITRNVPALENGDENFDPNNISPSDRLISFGLFTDVDGNNRIGETFYRHNFADYINKTMPSGAYVLKVSAAQTTDGDGLVYQAFTRTFTFTVQKGTLDVTDGLNGQSFEYEYDGNVHLYGSAFEPTVTALKYIKNTDRLGIWQNAQYNSNYGEALITFHLLRWQAEGGLGYEFVTRTQLENTLGKKQAPREVDTYTVRYKISAPNYSDYGGNKSFTVIIAKQALDIPDDKQETYNGEEHTYSVVANSPYSVSGNATFTDANESGYDITLVLTDTDNYKWKNIDDSSVTVKLIIRKQALDIPDDKQETYNGEEHTYSVAANSPYSVSGNATFTNANESGYDITLVLTDADNYKWKDIDNSSVTVKLVIKKANYTDSELAGITFADGTITYDGEEHSLYISGTLPDGISVAYTGNGKTTADSYTVTAVFSLSAELAANYNNAITDKTATLTINKAVYDMSGVTFGNLDVLYNGQLQTVTANGLPSGVTLSPVGAIEPGTYALTAEFIGDGVNYEAIPGIAVTLVIRRPQLIMPDSGGGALIEISAAQGFKPEIELVVTEVARENYGDYASIAQNANADIAIVYDIALRTGNVTVQPDGAVTVKLFVPETLRDKNFKLFFRQNGVDEQIAYTLDGNYAVVTTNSLSQFVFTTEKTASNGEDGNSTLWLILVIILACIVAAEAVFVIYQTVKRKKQTLK